MSNMTISQREVALIFEQILPTYAARKRMDISKENLSVNTGT